MENLPALIPLAIPVLIPVGIAIGYLALHGGQHGGVGFFQLRRVLRAGAAGTATIAAQRDVRTLSGSRVPVYVTEYLLDVQQPGSQPLRASVTLPLYWHEQRQLEKLSSVPVRIGEGIVVIDRSSANAMIEAAEQAAKAAKDRAFDELRNPRR